MTPCGLQNGQEAGGERSKDKPMKPEPNSPTRRRPKVAAFWVTAVLLAPPGTNPARAQQDLRTYPGETDAVGTEPPALEGGNQGPQSWTVREVEHLWNRAAFGASQSVVEAWVERGPVALVDHLLETESERDPFYVERLFLPRQQLRGLERSARRALQRKIRKQDREQFRQLVAWWFDRLLEDEGALTERMTLFWHGLFTSSYDKVLRSAIMADQNQLLRDNALGSYAKLLSGIVRDPAMLVYLDNDDSHRDSPNENLARELLELFSLGEGNFSERDVREAARALTGRGVDRGYFRFDEEAHDDGRKRIFNGKGRIGGGQLVRLILEHPACAPYIAGRLLTWFEGVPPEAERLRRYADLLLEAKWELRPFLRQLFLDPDFYRSEVMEARVASPVDYMVGAARRLGLKPPPAFLAAGSEVLGQALFNPPNVKGWEEGTAWITTGSLMNRGNLAGVMLGVIDMDSLRGGGSAEGSAAPASGMAGERTMAEEELIAEALASSEEGAEMMDMTEATSETEMSGEVDPSARSSEFVDLGDRAGQGGLSRVLRALERVGYRPNLNLSARFARRGLTSERELARALLAELLAIEPTASSIDEITRFLVTERDRMGMPEGRLFTRRRDLEPLLRRAAHRILALPEAQLL